MITRLVKLTIQPTRYREFIALYSQAQKQIRLFDGCVGLELLHDASKSNIVFTISKWKTENDLNGYRNSEFFVNVWNSVKPMFEEKAEAWSLKSAGN